MIIERIFNWCNVGKCQQALEYKTLNLDKFRNGTAVKGRTVIINKITNHNTTNHSTNHNTTNHSTNHNTTNHSSEKLLTWKYPYVSHGYIYVCCLTEICVVWRVHIRVTWRTYVCVGYLYVLSDRYMYVLSDKNLHALYDRYIYVLFNMDLYVLYDTDLYLLDRC